MEDKAMDFSMPARVQGDLDRFKDFLKAEVTSHVSGWYKSGEIPDSFFRAMGEQEWFGIQWRDGRLIETDALREALLQEALARLSSGVAIAVLAHIHLGLACLLLHGSETLKQAYAADAAAGKLLMCLGNSENKAGSDAAGIDMRAEKVDGGWRLNGAKAYVTNGAIARLGGITAVTDADSPRNRRISMFLVDLDGPGVRRTKLNKQVWIPSDLTRLSFTDVFVPDDHLLGVRGRGLQQVLEVFTRSRVPISALTLGTATGAFDLALERARRRTLFGRKIIDFQAKAFEFADFYARLEAVRMVILNACDQMDNGRDYRQTSSLAKYLAVDIARKVTPWAADMFGAVSVVFDHPIHKFPMDAWASSLGEGTQDVQKLIIFRELMKQYQD
jgi:alkylation response protein AidB-like acyl-CoA dehydrogenase